MESIFTASNHQVYHEAEYELLLGTLKLIWHNYVQEATGDLNVKNHWLQLFLYNFQFVTEELLDNDDFKRFFSPIPEELCSFLLEQVYEIISQSDLFMPLLVDRKASKDFDEIAKDKQQQQTPEKTKQFFNVIRKNHNFAQLILKQPSDCSKIVALRQFLTHQLGHHILEFLLKIQIKYIVSQASLCNLCINLFPNCPWDAAHYKQLKDERNIFYFVGNLHFYQKGRTKSITVEKTSTENDSRRINKEIFLNEKNSLSYDEFIGQTKTSDEIALLLIKLLAKCIENESQSIHADHSVLILTLNFSLDCLRVQNQAFSSTHNAEIIKSHLLKLNEQCLNSLFALCDQTLLGDIQFQCIFAKLVAALESNAETPKLLYALVYLIFAIMHNVVYMYSQKLVVSNNKKNLYNLKFVDETVIDSCLTTMDDLLRNYPPERDDIQSLFYMIFRNLLKVVESLKKYDIVMAALSTTTNVSSNNTNHSKFSSKNTTTSVHSRSAKVKQMHCLSSLPRLTCYFQNTLITLLPLLPIDLLEQSMLYLGRSGLCCCHYKLSLFNTILNNVFQLSPYYQKCAYKFLYNKFISTIFVRCQPTTETETSGMENKKSTTLSNKCGKCDHKLRATEFHDGFLQIYKTFYGKLADSDDVNLTNVLFFLKHLKHLSHLLTHNIASGILAEIVLPVFRSYKIKLFARNEMSRKTASSPQHTLKFWQNTTTLTSPKDTKTKHSKLRLTINSNEHLKDDYSKLCNECLNIFSMYLRDIRLIKAFYNEENIRHLEELLEEPFLIRGVCDLIKIGIDNITFLGDTSHEQYILSRRLITLQFNSSERAQHIFNSLLHKVQVQSKKVNYDFWVDSYNGGEPYHQSDEMQLKAVDILHIVALQWTLNYELLKTSQYFYNEFSKIYSIAHEDDDDVENDEQEQSKSNEDVTTLHTEINSNITLKPGDKTIVDILQLNCNALTAFLMLPPKMQTENNLAKPPHTNASSKNNDFDSTWELMENYFSSMQESSTLSAATTMNSSATTSTTTAATCFNEAAVFSLYSTTSTLTTSSQSQFDDIAEYKQSNPHKTQSFLKQLQSLDSRNITDSCSLDESIVVFDIRNQKWSNNQQDYHNSAQSLLCKHFISNDPETNLKTNNTTSLENESIINKVFHIFGNIFSSSRSAESLLDLESHGQSTRTQSSEKESEIDVNLMPLYDTRGDCKKLLLKLFEATMAICIKGYQNEEVEKMQKHLRKLKAVILSNATSNWDQHAEEHARENNVIQTLQCLLKIAELSNTVNEPAAVIRTSLANITTTDDPTQPFDLKTRRKSFNSSRISGGIYNYPQLSTALPSKNALVTPTTPIQKRPVSGESCEADYFSTRASVICPDSELDLSENEQDDFFLTADEGYDADAEIQDLSETEIISADVVELWHSFQPSSRYRTHILHEGICRLVVEILIELSQKCCANPTGWCNNLVQLINRLFVIRDYLGGPLFLLKGFAPVLKCNEPRLRELQQCILELVIDLNSPEVLSTFFSILASKNPPVDILVKYMHYISCNTLKKCQPSVELEFPINIEETCCSTADSEVSEAIERKRSYHMYRKASTPFTRAPCILPITHAKLWTQDGLTVSFWLQAKSSHNSKSTSQIADDDTRSSGDLYSKTHVLSIGSNQAMLSVYLSSNNHLLFETFKPNAEVPRHVVSQLDESYETKHATPDLNPPPSPELKRNRKNNHTPADENNIEMDNLTSSKSNAAAPSPFSKALKQTKNVILNSFSNMHLFNGHSETTECFECARVDLKPFRMNRNKWTHLTIAVEMVNDSLELCVHIDGLEQHKLTLPFPNVRLLTRTQAFQLLALGDGQFSRSANNTSCAESRSTFDSNPMRFSISNLMVFNRSITLKEIILNLTAMGPDLSELTQCQVANWKPNYGFLNFSKMHSDYYGTFNDAMKLLRESRILCYSAAQPTLFMGYDSTTVELDNVSFGRPYGIMCYGELQKNELQSLQTATILCGGVYNLLYLFARVVELNSNSSTQAMALDILLTIALSDSQLYTDFQRNDCIGLIGFVIKTERSTKDCQLLRSIVNNACSQPLILKKGGDILQVNETTVATVVYPKLLISILHRYSDWHRSGAKHSDVLDMLFQCLLALTREKHPQRDFNIDQLSKECLLKELLNLFKVYVMESPNPVFISKKAAEYFVSIISVFAGSPPEPYLLDEIMKLLLLLHKPSECYITHDRSKFYFLLTAEKPIREKSYLTSSNHFGRVTAPFKRNITTSYPAGAAAKQLKTENGNANTNLSSNSTQSSQNTDIDAARQARINRLRKLHRLTSASVYKKPLHDFEENLEDVADCSKLNKNALRLVSPTEALKWRSKYKKLTSSAALPASPKQAFSPQKKRRSKGKFQLRQSPGRKIERRKRRLNSANSSRSPSSMDTDQPKIFDFAECPGLQEVLNSQSAFHLKKMKSLYKVDTYSSIGISALQSGLLLLLKDFLCLLPDNSIDVVLRHYIKVDFLLVLANHQSSSVRAAVIKLISALTQRLFPQDIQSCVKAYYPHHLANQLSIGACDGKMFEACLEWVCGSIGCMETHRSTCEYSLCIQQCFGLNALLAIASKSVATSTCQSDLSERAFKVLKKLYSQGEPDEQHCMLEAGLIQCCVKALYHLYSKTTPYNIKVEESIADTLTIIGQMSLQSNGQIHIVWDIINMLIFYQAKQPHAIIKGYRSIQAKLQLNWLNSFFVPTNVPWSFKIQQIPNLSMSETRTRLELLHNKCGQFFMIFNEKTTPTKNEIDLFQMLVSFSIATNQRCNNFIAWGLQPSQPRELRSFIVDALWISCQDDFLPAIICDGKMIKALLWLSLLEDLDEPIHNLHKLCNRLGINENDSTWNLENELQRMDLQKTTEAAKQKTFLEKTVFKYESLTIGCIESSMITTRRVAELQNSERKLLMNHMKDYDDTHYYTKWLEIVRRMTYEGASWFSDHINEKSWELDATEGPSRVHTRLKRCHLDIEKRFFMQSFEDSSNSNSFPINARSEYIRPLEYLISSYDQQLNISLNSQILYNFPAKYLPIDGEIDGEIIVTDHKLYFLATYKCRYFYVNCDISNITEIWLKRYEHHEKAFEIFLDTNQSFFFSLLNQEDWKVMREVFCDKIVTPPDHSKVQLITQQWREGLLTNWEYLMTLNQIGGRTYNDLMQYPVFPWILSNYTSDILDLTDMAHFRNLAKPIAIQNEDNEQHYRKNYADLQNNITKMGSIVLKPYHYSSTYSNSGTVLHYLVRLPPFTKYFLRYQDNNFDLPDRTFHALSTTFSLASRDSLTVKELVPEFFCLPEMFENFERFNFGCRQNDERVEDVLLPPWCSKDPRLFVLIHRQALETELVRNNLHHWIDLIFGFKQTGEAAVEAINVFHPATYAVFLDSEINDPIERRAVETMVKTYGQMPRQLFKTPHPPSKMLVYQSDKQILPSVRGLRWGVYLGSPQLPEPTLGNTHKLIGAEYLLSFNNTNVVYGLPARSCVMQGAETDTFNVISWGYDDRIVRIQPLNKLHAKPKNLLYNSTFDDITAGGCDPNSNQLWFGHKSGRISIYKCSSMEYTLKTGKSRQSYVKDLRFSYNSAFRKIMSKAMDSEVDLSTSTTSGNSLNSSESNLHKDGADLSWNGPTVLIRHTDEITCIALSVEFKLAVTAGNDGIAVIWDLNDWSYVRTIERPTEIHHSPITLVTISHTLGDIVTVHSLTQSQQQPPNPNSDTVSSSSLAYTSVPIADECFEVTEENLDDFVNVCINPNGKSILRLHSVNARYVQHFVHEDRITAVCCSYIKEGVGVNVIATAVEGGIIRLWSSWNLSFITEIITGISNIVSLTYSTHQHLVVLTENSHIQVWETKGLCGTSPKFPQIAYK